MKDDEKKHGVRRGPVRVVARPTNMQLKKVSKAQFLEIRQREIKANDAAETARRKSLAEQQLSEDTNLADETTDSVVANDPVAPAAESLTLQQKVQAIKKDLKEARASLAKEPKSAKLKKKIAGLEAQLDEAEDALEDLEDNSNNNQ